MDNINEILNTRAKTHGDFSEVAITAQLLKNNIFIRLQQTSKYPLNDTQRESVDMICSKLARIISGDPNEIDHWRDIAGYALLVVKELESINDECDKF